MAPVAQHGTEPIKSECRLENFGKEGLVRRVESCREWARRGAAGMARRVETWRGPDGPGKAGTIRHDVAERAAEWQGWNDMEWRDLAQLGEPRSVGTRLA